MQKGDRICGFIPNIPEAIIAMLATASIGAIWSSSSPDFGIKGVLDRFIQIEPKIIFAANGYFYNGKTFDSLDKLQGILNNLPSVEKVVVVEPAMWVTGAILIIKRWSIGYYFLTFFFVAMTVAELTHFIFPFILYGEWKYTAGVATAALPLIPAWYGLIITIRETQKLKNEN